MSLREEVGAILDAAGIRHALIGALALSAYGVNRVSLDLDPGGGKPRPYIEVLIGAPSL